MQDKLNHVILTLYGPCIVIYLPNNNQPDAISLYILQFHLNSLSSYSSLMYDTYQYLHIQEQVPPEDEQLVCSKYVEDIFRVKYVKKVHLVGLTT